jgi:hypothetical protein
MNGKEKIILGKIYHLDMGGSGTTKLKTISFKDNGIECEYLMSYQGRKEIIQYSIWEMNGFRIPKMNNSYMDLDTELTNVRPIFKVCDPVLVCDELETVIEKVDFDDNYQEYIYYFLDEYGGMKCENSFAITPRTEKNIAVDVEQELNKRLQEQLPSHIKEMLNKKDMNLNPLQEQINVINDTIKNGVNFNIESEAIRLTSSHYKLQRGLWSWQYGDEVEKDSWEMAKEHAKLTAEENIKQVVINSDIKKDDKLMNFWFDVIRKIDKL